MVLIGNIHLVQHVQIYKNMASSVSVLSMTMVISLCQLFHCANMQVGHYSYTFTPELLLAVRQGDVTPPKELRTVIKRMTGFQPHQCLFGTDQTMYTRPDRSDQTEKQTRPD